MKKTFGYVTGFLVGVCVVTPFAASALTIGDLQNQVQALLARISRLQNQPASIPENVQDASVSSAASMQGQYHRACAAIYKDLAAGSRGDDVVSLQEYLRDKGFLNANPSGYYGSLTLKAVAQWQVAQGVNPLGRFGPASRARLQLLCGNGVGSNVDFSASPTYGPGPLTVTFLSRIGDGLTRPSYVDGADTMIDFGDGTEPQWVSCGHYREGLGSGRCAAPVAIQHIYNLSGDYTATLQRSGGDCIYPCPVSLIAQVKIHVGEGNIVCPAIYQPVCGSKQVVCIKAPCYPVQQTYPSRCELTADGATFLYEGQCRTNTDPANDPQCKRWNDGRYCGQTCSRSAPGGTPICAIPSCLPQSGVTPADKSPQCLEYFSQTSNPANDPQCKAWFDGCNSCSRQAPGEPGMCTLMACLNTQTPYCKLRFGDAENKAPIISGISGPTSLSINQTGTWSVQARDPEGGQLSYNISWGDEYIPYALAASSARDAFTQQATFTHSYANSGTYTVSIIVRDQLGLTAQSSLTVQVGQNIGSCPMDYAPVCGQPPEPACRHSFPACMVPTPGPRTYGNLCMMHAEGASLLYTGECSNSF